MGAMGQHTDTQPIAVAGERQTVTRRPKKGPPFCHSAQFCLCAARLTVPYSIPSPLQRRGLKKTPFARR